MRVKIEREECISCGTCWSTCPDFFEEDPEDGYCSIIEQHRVGGDPAEGEAPADLEDCVREAAEECPVEIIHLDE